jgi:hypothetical protein
LTVCLYEPYEYREYVGKSDNEKWFMAEKDWNANWPIKELRDSGIPFNSGGGYIYFIQSLPSGPTKVGFTKSNPESRVSALQTGNPWPLRLVALATGTPGLEAFIHEMFAFYRLKGEWFLSYGWGFPELVAFFQSLDLAEDPGDPSEGVDG